MRDEISQKHIGISLISHVIWTNIFCCVVINFEFGLELSLTLEYRYSGAHPGHSVEALGVLL